MSYILDALRRADAERQQGQIPGLYAAPEALAPPQGANRNWLLWAAAVMVLLALGALMRVWWNQAPTASTPLALPTPLTPPAAAPPAPPAPSPLPIVVSAAPVAPVATEATPATITEAPTPQPTTLPRAPSAAPQAPTSAATLPKPVPLQQLAQNLRRELPGLVVGGSVWSPGAANRFIILDGVMLREGDVVARGLVLESIQPKSAVLRWRDLRLELAL